VRALFCHTTLKRRIFISLLSCQTICLIFFVPYTAKTQICPPNIDFEKGNFDNWTCYTGSVSAAGGQNVISLSPSGGPVFDQHTMYKAGAQVELDPFGGFPVNCPNGSGYSIRLGNNTGGGRAEGISYEFTIPANANEYSLIYHYAVVFQDPRHQTFQQPRLQIEITNLTDNEKIDCSSFDFYPFGTLLPGFKISPLKQGNDTTDVWYKDWTAVSINLNNKAGKTIRLFFKTADCTFTRHFGYAYIDVNSECSSEFVGAAYCPDDLSLNVTAPYGYQNYTWYNNNFSQSLGSQQTLSITPTPPSGSVYAVEIVPFDGYGCLDTLYAKVIDTLTITPYAGIDTFSCNMNPVPLGERPKPGLVYSWSPVAGLTNNNISNPFASPAITTSYVLTVRNSGGGCATTDTVVVRAAVSDSSVRVLGKEAYCITSNDSAVLVVQPTDSIQWFRDNVAIPGATKTKYKATRSGSYRALLFNDLGCSISTFEKQITIETPKKGIKYPEEFAIFNYPQQLQARNIGVSAEWSPPTYLDDPLKFSPMFKGSADKQYTIAIKSISGCITVDTLYVKIFKNVKIYVPTAFTPNNDGLNDYLKPQSVGIKQINYFRIYNRWGQFLFDLKSNPLGWDGKIGGKPQSTQTFVWMAEGIGIDNRTYHEKGSVVLIR
jgi:gliding motility-associated-like protein